LFWGVKCIIWQSEMTHVATSSEGYGDFMCVK